MARPINYLVDGSGRDNYIANNNGGLYVAHKPASALTSGVFRTRQRPSSSLCNLGVKRSHYYCDGTGRDRYVLKSEIPTFAFSQAEQAQNFFQGFRTYKEKSRPSDFARPVATKQARAMSKVTPKTTDPYLKSQTFFFKNDQLRQSNASLLKYQHAHCESLA